MSHHLNQHRRSCSQPDGKGSKQQLRLSPLGWSFLFVIPLLLIVFFNKVIGIFLMSAGVWGPLFVIFWLMQVKEEAY